MHDGTRCMALQHSLCSCCSSPVLKLAAPDQIRQDAGRRQSGYDAQLGKVGQRSPPPKPRLHMSLSRRLTSISPLVRQRQRQRHTAPSNNNITTAHTMTRQSPRQSIQRRRSSCSQHQPSIKPFYLSNSPVSRLLALPQQALFALLGMVGLATWAHQIVRVRSKQSAAMPGGVGGTIDQWITENVPSLKGTFTPAWWLPK